MAIWRTAGSLEEPRETAAGICRLLPELEISICFIRKGFNLESRETPEGKGTGKYKRYNFKIMNEIDATAEIQLNIE